LWLEVRRRPVLFAASRDQGAAAQFSGQQLGFQQIYLLDGNLGATWTRMRQALDTRIDHSTNCL
jgi:hypothetical protein